LYCIEELIFMVANTVLEYSFQKPVGQATKATSL